MTKRRLQLVRLSDIEPKEVRWLWKPYLVRGKINNLQGEGGNMKTTIAIDIAARVTTGRSMPYTDDPLEPGNVFYFTIEDDPADTILPRFLSAEGDPTRMWTASGMVHHDPQGNPIRGVLSLAHVNEIRAGIEEYKPDLLVVDPVTSFLGTDVDMHRANEVRPVMEHLSVLAQEHDVTILNILHIGKGTGGSAAYRALGSVDFANTARSVLYVGEHQEKRAMAQAKMNMAAKGPSRYYEAAPGSFEIGGEPVNRILWGGICDLTADQLADARNGPQGTPGFTKREVEDMILAELSVPMTAKTLKQNVIEGIGVGRHTFEQARASLHKRALIDHRRHGFGPESGIFWYRTDRPVEWGDRQ
ncbi:MAG: AAA family ATPase [Trueperaceae bacterium]